MIALELLCKVFATLAAAVFVWAIWAERMTIAWGAWMAQFLGAEGLAFQIGGTLSGIAWWLMDRPVGATIVSGLLIWLLYHWWLEPRFFPALRGGLGDDGKIAAGGGLLGLILLFTSRPRK